MRHWVLNEIDTPGGTLSPVVLHSQNGSERVVLLELEPGQALGDHGVKEAALILVLAGRIVVEAGGESVDAGVGELFRFEPDERHAVTSEHGARILLTLAPWPGEGHYRGDPAGAPVSAS